MRGQIIYDLNMMEIGCPCCPTIRFRLAPGRQTRPLALPLHVEINQRAMEILYELGQRVTSVEIEFPPSICNSGNLV